MIDKLRKIFEGKKILILGMGREGESTLGFLKRNFPDLDIKTADKKFGSDYLNNLEDFDLIIKSPGIPWNLNEIKKAKRSGVVFISQTQIFLELFSDKTIGVTGTKGKSTTASLIFNILKTAGKKTVLVGNIEKPALDYIDGDNNEIFIYEMSSHQLSDVTKSPHTGVFLNIYPEHLDYYSNYEEYFQAKANITRYQNVGDLFVYCSDFPEIEKLAITTKAKKIGFSLEKAITDFDLQNIEIPLKGNHNLNNVKASIIVARELGVADSIIRKGIESFVPLEDRLQTVGVVGGVTFVDDSLATIPQATMGAVDVFRDKKVTLILGGFDRGIDFGILGEYLKNMTNVTNVILIGQTANNIQNMLIKDGFKGKIHNLGKPSMREVVSLAYKITTKGGIALLSPASTSFDMFENYKARADQFKKAVREL